MTPNRRITTLPSMGNISSKQWYNSGIIFCTKTLKIDLNETANELYSDVVASQRQWGGFKAEVC